MKRTRFGWMILLALAVALFISAGTPDAKKKADSKKVVATRVHFSGNMEGELDPCG